MKYMDLDQYEYEETKLIEYGFQKQNTGYAYTIPLRSHEYYCLIQIDAKELSVDVYDAFDDELFLPFYVKRYQSAYLAEMKAEIDRAVNQIIAGCFTICDGKQILLSFARDYFHTASEYPWENLSHCVLKTANKQKWCAIFMRIPYKTLGMNRQGSVDIVNVKAEPQAVTQLIDNRHYFSAYHMNKKYWLTILLDRETDLEKAKALLKDSYSLVGGKK